MNNITRKQVQSFILDYLKKRIPNFEIKGKMFKCPFEHNHKQKSNTLTANIFPSNSHTVHCYDPDCGKLGDIISLCRKIDFCGNEDVDDDEIISFLKKEFKIQTDDTVSQLFEKFSNFEWDLVPVAKNEKASNVEKEWQKKSHKDINEWIDWYNSGLNLGCKTGKVSNIICIDFDLVESKLKKRIYEGNPTEKQLQDAKEQYDTNLSKLKALDNIIDWETLQQKSFGGIHLFYIYDEEIPKTNLDIEGIHVDILNDGGQVVIQPSIVGGFKREIIGDVIKPIPEGLKELILKNKIVEKEELISEETNLASFDGEKIVGLDGNCNNTFVKLGGILRTFLTSKEVEETLQVVNQNLLDTPMPRKDIIGMCNQFKKYNNLENDVLTKKVFDFIQRHLEASLRDLRECIKAEPNEIKEVLAYLIDNQKIYKQKSLYKSINKADWKTAFIEESKTLDYTIPYFNNYATFRRGDMVCIGATTGGGKSYIALNLIRQLQQNSIKPKGGIRYLSSEPGNRFAKIAMEMGLKEGDFYFCNHYEPEKIELEDDAVTIIDWLLPEDFSGTASLYKIFARQLDKHGGVCFIFSQLNKDNEFYASNMVKFFASFACKYMFTNNNGTLDTENTYFKTDKIRESKVGQQYITIPTYFNQETKFLDLKKI